MTIGWVYQVPGHCLKIILHDNAGAIDDEDDDSDGV